VDKDNWCKTLKQSQLSDFKTKSEKSEIVGKSKIFSSSKNFQNHIKSMYHTGYNQTSGIDRLESSKLFFQHKLKF